MENETKTKSNVKQAVPFFGVTDMEASLHFYVDGLGFKMTNNWAVDGKIRWCWLELDNVAIMLQVLFKEGVGPWVPEEKLGVGATISFQCEDALAIYHAATAKGLQPSRPFVGNAMWVTTIYDPNGYRLEFESPTEVPEGTEYKG
jgi:lactoylglutathione lyase